MLYIDVGNSLRGGLRTGIQRVVRSLSHELAANSPTKTRLIAFDVSAGRYFAVNRAPDATRMTGGPVIFVTEPRGTPIAGESVRLGEVCWIPLLPPDKPVIRFYATLDSGARLETRVLLTVVAGEGGS
jgi:hypothetical protein